MQRLVGRRLGRCNHHLPHPQSTFTRTETLLGIDPMPGITAGARTRLLGGMGTELEDQDSEVLVHPRLLVRVPASGVIG